MANFFRQQSAARAALRPGLQIKFIHGQGYRLVPAAGYSPPSSPFAGLPTYVPPDQGAIRSQAQTQAQGIADPILAQISERQNRDIAEAQQRAAAQEQSTKAAYAAAREPLAQLYNSAIGQSTALEEAISAHLKGTGQEQGAAFAERLKQMGAPGQGATDLATTYQGQNAANYASGMADVGRLVSRGAEARAWNEKAPAIAAQESQRTLGEDIRALQKQYGDQSGEIRANLPGQVQELFDKLYGQAEGTAKAGYESRWEQINYLQKAKQDALEAQVVAQQMGDKKAYQQAQLRQKELDRQLKAEIAASTEAGKNARDNPPATASGPTMKFNPDGTPNPNYVPPTAKPAKSKTTPAYVVNSVWGRIWSPDTGTLKPEVQKRLQKMGSKNVDAVLNGYINNQIRAFNIDPFSKAGINLRRSILARLNGHFIKGVGVYESP